MRILSLEGSQQIKLTTFPDGQPHIQILDPAWGMEKVMVTCSINSVSKLIQLLELSNSLDYLKAEKTYLWIPYLMSARSDRHMIYGDSFDLEVVANLINSCNFKQVELLDVHSEVALNLIKNSVNKKIDLTKELTEGNLLYICPDKGAKSRVPEGADVIFCEKSRDLNTGKITLTVNNPKKCLSRNCVIVDDICDGGGTFNAIAEQVREYAKTMALCVTHGIFSQGVKQLFNSFETIVTTNSYRRKDDVFIKEVYGDRFKIVRVI